MAAFSLSTRSISFPPRFPQSSRIEEALYDLKDGVTSKVSISQQLASLAELYGYVSELILSPSTQHALLHQHQGKFIEEALDGSVGLLDVCNTMRELTLQLREQVWDLQSVLRRKGYSNVENEVRIYMGFRKTMTKSIVRCLKGLKQRDGTSNKCSNVAACDLEPQLAYVVKVQREVCDVAMGVFQSTCSFLSMPIKASGWELMSKLVRGSTASVSENQKNYNEVLSVDSELVNLHGHGGKNSEVVQGRLQALDSRLQSVEGELERVSRRLVENRVSLLNIVTGLSV